jgi:hypothetical protein
MRRTWIVIAAVALAACMDKQPDGTYRVPVKTETRTARDNAAKAGESVRKATDEIANSEAAQKVRAGAKELGRATEKGVGVVATKAGEKLQEVGRKAQEDAAKRH